MNMLVLSAIIVVAFFTLVYIVGAIIKNAGIVDIGWGFGFVVLAWLGFFLNVGIPSMIFYVLVSFWGLRLTYHIFKRNVGKPEDFRYANFRRNWGRGYYVRLYFQVFIFQAVLMFAIALPVIYAQQAPAVFSWAWVIAGIVVWLAGFAFESVADAQLKKHVSDPANKGKLIDSGLWRISRHPNYFGEVVLWWGVYFAALGCGAPVWTIIGPLAITLMIRFVSGVPMLERSLKKREGFEAYAASVNTFVPWFRKKAK